MISGLIGPERSSSRPVTPCGGTNRQRVRFLTHNPTPHPHAFCAHHATHGHAPPRLALPPHFRGSLLSQNLDSRCHRVGASKLCRFPNLVPQCSYPLPGGRQAPISDARYRYALAISSTSPSLLSGLFCFMLVRTVSGTIFTISVFINPGATAFTVILYLPSSFAQVIQVLTGYEPNVTSRTLRLFPFLLSFLIGSHGLLEKLPSRRLVAPFFERYCNEDSSSSKTTSRTH